MREIVLDTETTGLDPRDGHRVVEIGCIELRNHVPTGETYWTYINPQRDMPVDAIRIHGLSEAFLSEQPVFANIVDDFLEFVRDDTLVIHNASFDIRFLNAELEQLGRDKIPMDRAVDTVQLARKKFPGASVSLDNLCRYFRIDNTNRTLHGALLDSRLLSEVYLELLGGAQQGLGLAAEAAGPTPECAGRKARLQRAHSASDAEKVAHAAFLERLTDPIWRREA